MFIAELQNVSMQGVPWNPASSTSLTSSNSVPITSSVISHSSNPLEAEEGPPNSIQNHGDFIDGELSEPHLDKDIQVMGYPLHVENALQNGTINDTESCYWYLRNLSPTA